MTFLAIKNEFLDFFLGLSVRELARDNIFHQKKFRPRAEIVVPSTQKTGPESAQFGCFLALNHHIWHFFGNFFWWKPVQILGTGPTNEKKIIMKVKVTFF